MRAFSPEKLKERRKIFRLTQADLAQIAGLSTTYINYIERGKREPGADVIARLAWVLRVKENYFFVNTPEKKITKRRKKSKNGEKSSSSLGSSPDSSHVVESITLNEP